MKIKKYIKIFIFFKKLKNKSKNKKLLITIKKNNNKPKSFFHRHLPNRTISFVDIKEFWVFMN
jgi:hypothetical protein